jgi:hypothetical protein
MAGPTNVELFTYRVGFGDCFLLRFTYPRFKRHVLIDFGSTGGAPRGGPTMLEVAANIRRDCGGKLDAIVATHRHADHISGFSGKTWEIIRKLNPELVLLPWTEDADAATDATAATRAGAPALGRRSLHHLSSLRSMQKIASAAFAEVNLNGDEEELVKLKKGSDEPENDEEGRNSSKPFGATLTKQLYFLGQSNLANAAAVKNLMTVERDFLFFGSQTRLSRMLPGVRVHVLGPPTLEQTETIRNQRTTDASEFWHLSAKSARVTAGGKAPFQGQPADKAPVEARWFVKRMDGLRGDEMLELVRILDSAMNNTSLILLFETRGKKLLFPGDAQIENWSYALSKPSIRKLLAGVDVYKVGHHGSLNATPKKLWKLFEKKGASKRLKTFLSTKSGKHGDSRRGTEVPRKTLLEELRAKSELLSTAEAKGKSAVRRAMNQRNFGLISERKE